MGFVVDVLLFFATNAIVISLVSGFLGGEEIILFLSFLSGQGTLPFWILFVFAYIGTIASNILWYFAGKTIIIDKIVHWKKIRKTYEKIVHLIDKSKKRNEILALFVTKVIYGTRIITIMLLSKKGMSFLQFVIYSSTATLVWYIIVIPIGWLAGRGFTFLFEILENLQLAIAFIVSAIVVFYIIRVAVHNYIVKKHKMHGNNKGN